MYSIIRAGIYEATLELHNLRNDNSCCITMIIMKYWKLTCTVDSGNQKISKHPVFYNLEDIVYFFLAFNCENDIYRV